MCITDDLHAEVMTSTATKYVIISNVFQHHYFRSI